MKIINVEIDKIKPYIKNSRHHPQEQIESLARSIQQYGFNQPLVLDEGHEIIVGHGRYLAAKSLQHQKVPCVVVENLSEERKRAYRILDNKLQEESSWDFNFLTQELIELQDLGLDVASWGLDHFLVTNENLEYDESSMELDAETYLKNTVRQIVLTYQREQHAVVLERLAKVGEQFGLQNDNASVVVELLDFYEKATA